MTTSPHDDKRFGRPTVCLVATFVLLTVLRVVVAGVTNLTEDEAYYRMWSLVPARSYFDHPPMVAWLIAAGRSLAGDNPLGIRLPAIVTSVLTAAVLWRAALILFGAAVADCAVWFLLAMPLYLIGGILITPDAPSVLFWALSFWSVAELQASGNANWWFAIGIFSGLGFLSKYTNLFLSVSILIWLIAAPENRKWFRNWKMWSAGLVFVLLSLPVVSWNVEHGGASFARQFGRVVAERGLTLRYFSEFLAAFLALASPVIAALAAAGLGHSIRKAIRSPSAQHLLLAIAIVPLLAFFVTHTFHGRVQAHWPAPLYPLLAICAAAFIGTQYPHSFTRNPVRLSQCAVVIGLIMSAVACAHILHPLILRPAVKDPTLQMRGWANFADEVERIREEKGACWIATLDYSTASQLSYELRSRAPVAALTERIRYVHLPPIDAGTLRCPAIYVELTRRHSPEYLTTRFQRVIPLGTLQRHYRQMPLAEYTVALLEGAAADVLDR